MSKSFLTIVLEFLDIPAAEAALDLGYSRQRVAYLLSAECKGVSIGLLKALEERLGISKTDLKYCLEQWAEQHENEP